MRLDSGGGAVAFVSNRAISASVVILAAGMARLLVPMARLKTKRSTEPAASGPVNDAVAIFIPVGATKRGSLRW
jgi:hypothetical protein